MAGRWGCGRRRSFRRGRGFEGGDDVDRGGKGAREVVAVEEDAMDCGGNEELHRDDAVEAVVVEIEAAETTK